MTHAAPNAAFAEMVARMRGCEQSPGVSVLRHGIMVRDRYDALVTHLRDGRALGGDWRLPDWTADPLLVEGLLPDVAMARYLAFHDCGKPDALVVDAEGRRHFPGHAAASERAWLAAGGEPEVGRLIGMDMDVHLLRDDGVPAFAARPEARALMLAGLAEVHANAAMFGGIGTPSFKAKWKNLDRRGRAVLREMRRVAAEGGM